MRIQASAFFCMLCLSGCVNYANMHSTATPLDTETLAKHQHYSPQQHAAADGWWRIFHDAELNRLVATALNNSPTLAVAENRVTQAEQIAKEAGATLWPAVDAEVNLSRERYSAHTFYPPPFGGHTYNQATVGLSFQYEFDWWGKNRQALAAKLSKVEATHADLAAAQLIISSAVVNAYLQLQYNIAAEHINKNLYAERKAELDIINDRAKNNIASDIPVSTTIARVQSSELALERAKRNVEIAEHKLAVLMGKNPLTTHITSQAYRNRNYSFALPSNLPANLLANRPDILAARARLEAAAHEVNVSKARFFPNINLHALLSMQTIAGWNYLFNTDSQDHSLGVAIDLPIFDANKRRADLGTKYAEYDIAVNQYNETILSALRETADQITLLQSLRHEKNTQLAALHATQRNYNLTLARYHNGITDYLSVIDIKQALLQQQATQIQIETQYQQALVGLIKALGGQYA